jgi:hypothetical protein
MVTLWLGRLTSSRSRCGCWGIQRQGCSGKRGQGGHNCRRQHEHVLTLCTYQSGAADVC